MKHRVIPPRNPENKSILKPAVKVNSKEVLEPEKPEKERSRRHLLRAPCKLNLWGQGEGSPAGTASQGREEKHREEDLPAWVAGRSLTAQLLSQKPCENAL